MRELDVRLLTDALSRAYEEINYALSPDVCAAIRAAGARETSPLGREILGQLSENLDAAVFEQIPVCQDTGMAVVFLELGQDVHLTGGDLTEAVNEGVRRACREGYLRRSVVSDPLDRVNTGDNAPAILHVSIVPGEKVTLTVTAKGFGSENCSRLFLLKPADGVQGVRSAVLTTVREAGGNACPPVVVGVGIGGDFEKCALMAKHALTRPLGEPSPLERDAALERELLDELNALGIGPAGLGGSVTALAVHVESYPTHIAGLPCAVNLCCHVDRHKTVVL